MNGQAHIHSDALLFWNKHTWKELKYCHFTKAEQHPSGSNKISLCQTLLIFKGGYKEKAYKNRIIHCTAGVRTKNGWQMKKDLWLPH